MDTCIISYKKRITSPGSIQDPWGWSTGMTQRDGMGREVGGGFRMEAFKDTYSLPSFFSVGDK